MGFPVAVRSPMGLHISITRDELGQQWCPHLVLRFYDQVSVIVTTRLKDTTGTEAELDLKAFLNQCRTIGHS